MMNGETPKMNLKNQNKLERKTKMKNEISQRSVGGENIGGENLPEPIDVKVKGEVAALTMGGDPEIMLAVLEKKAQLAPRYKAARDIIILSQTYKEDWVRFGDTACLKSAAAERIGTMFEISFSDLRIEKENFTDSNGKGYRYRAQITGELYGRKTIGVGLYDSREPFLGKKDKEFRPLEDINENDIQMAAVHIARGDAVKSLLGLRGLPISELEKILKGVSQTATNVEHKTGLQGGTSKSDVEKQKQLWELCMQIAEMPASARFDEQINDCQIIDITAEEAEMSTAVERADIIAIQMSSFVNKEGKVIKGKKHNELTGNWLNSTIGRIKKAIEGVSKNGN